MTQDDSYATTMNAQPQQEEFLTESLKTIAAHSNAQWAEWQ